MSRGTYLWLISRTIKPDRLDDFNEAWTPKRRPKGLITAYLCISDKDANEIIGISVWSSRETCQAYMQSSKEKERRAAMRPLIEGVNWVGFYTIRSQIGSWHHSPQNR